MKNIIYNEKWIDIINLPKYQVMREKISDSFKDLVFYEEEHRYFVGERELTCVSNVTHMFQEHFDEDKIAQKTFERNYDNPESKYFQMTPDQIKDCWHKISSDACTLGTARHLFAENLCYFMMGRYDLITPEYIDRLQTDENGKQYFEAKLPKEIAALNFWLDVPRSFVPIMPETKVYDKDLGYSGTFDLLMYYDAELDGKSPENSGLVILDWKTNVDLYKNYNNKKLLEPLSHLLDMSLSIYKIQLSLYQNCLNKIGLKTVARRILWLRPDGTYQKIPTESLVEIVIKHLQTHPIE